MDRQIMMALALVIAVITASATVICIASEESDAASTVYIGGDNANDDNAGTQDAPVATMGKAVELAGSGGSIVLGSDIIVTEQIGTKDDAIWAITNEISLDLAGHNLILSMSKSFGICLSTDNGKLTVSDSVGTGTIKAGSTSVNQIVRLLSGSTFVLNGGTITTEGASSTAYAINVNGWRDSANVIHTSTTILNGGTVYSNTSNPTIGLSTFTNLEINGARVQNATGGGYSVNSAGTTATVTLTSGEVIGDIHFNSGYEAPFTWSGGTYTGEIDFDALIIPDGNIGLVSSDGTEKTFSFVDTVPSTYTASIGNCYFTTLDGPDIVESSFGYEKELTFYQAPSDGEISITLTSEGDYVVISLYGSAASITPSVTADGYEINSVVAGDATTYTATVTEASANVKIEETGAYYSTFQLSYEALEPGQTIVLMKDQTIDRTIGILKDMTLDLNGKILTFSMQNSHGFQVESSFTVEDSQATTSTMDFTTYDVTYSGGSIVLNRASEEHSNLYVPIYVIARGHLSFESGSIVATNAGGVTILGSGEISGGYIKATHDAVGIMGSGTLNVTGGIMESTGHAGIGGSAGEVAYNGTTINVSGGIVFGHGSTACGMYITQFANVNISDDAHILASDGAGIIMRAGYLNISGGTVESHGTGTQIFTQSDEPLPKSAVVMSYHTGYDSTSLGFGGSITGGTFISDNGMINVSYSTNVADEEYQVIPEMLATGGNYTSTVDDEFQADGYEIETDGDMVFTGTEVASIDGKSYGSLDNAITDAKEGQTITLNQDTSLVQRSMGKGINLDLRTHTLTIEYDGSGYGYGLTFDTGKSTITNGTILDSRSVVNNANGFIAVHVTGQGTSLTMTNVIVNQYLPSSTTSYNIGLRVEEGATLTAGSGTQVIELERTTTVQSVGVAGVMVLGGDTTTTFNMDGATIETTGFGVLGNGTYNSSIDYSDTVINFRSGTITSGSWAIYHPQGGVLNISGGEITGRTGIEIRAGELNITGNPTITATGSFNRTDNGSGTTTSGVAIAIAQHTTHLPIEVNISGGSFTGRYALYEWNAQNNDTEYINMINVSVTGGNFNGETADVCLEDFQNLADESGISGGSFSDDSAWDYLDPGLSLDENGTVQEAPEYMYAFEVDPIEVLKGDSVTVTVIDNADEHSDITYTLSTLDGTPIDEGKTISFVPDAEEYVLKISGTHYGVSVNEVCPIYITIVPSVMLTFHYPDGSIQEIEVAEGEPVTIDGPDEVPEQFGYEFAEWRTGSGESLRGYIPTEDTDLYPGWDLVDPTVSVSVSGDLYRDGVVIVTVTATHVLDDQGVRYTYLMGNKDTGRVTEQASNVFYIRSEGTYLFGADAILGDSTGRGTYEGYVEVELNVPVIPDDDDDYVPPTPPDIVVNYDDSGDAAVGIAACAAAAVAAAIIACLIIMERRRN